MEIDRELYLYLKQYEVKEDDQVKVYKTDIPRLEDVWNYLGITRGEFRSRIRWLEEEGYIKDNKRYYTMFRKEAWCYLPFKTYTVLMDSCEERVLQGYLWIMQRWKQKDTMISIEGLGEAMGYAAVAGTRAHERVIHALQSLQRWGLVEYEGVWERLDGKMKMSKIKLLGVRLKIAEVS